MSESEKGASPPPRYFYTDPLAAAWMAKHFGVAYSYIGNETEQYPVRAEIFSELMGQAIQEHLSGESECTRFFLHSDSLPLLEPRDGDMVRQGNDVRYAGEYASYTGSIYSAGDRPIFDWDEYCRIIQRDGRPFFWPERQAI